MKDEKVDMLVAQVIPTTHDFEKEYQLSAKNKKRTKRIYASIHDPPKMDL